MAQPPEKPKLGAERQVQERTVRHAGQGSEGRSAHDVRPAVDGSAGPLSDEASNIELLLKTVESELIPRLFVNHMMRVPARSAVLEQAQTEPQPGPWCSDSCIEAFAAICISNNPECLDQHVTQLLAQGVTLESIFIYLLTPVARFLGAQWETDRLSFVDVHLGLCRLHQLICECEHIGAQSEALLPSHSILLSCAPGDDHTFGVTMVADFFRRYGWQVSNLCGLDSEYLLQRMASTHYSAIGFSLHCDENYTKLASLIRRVRNQSCNKELVIMVGGEFFIQYPNYVSQIGADMFARDGRQAVLKAREEVDKTLQAQSRQLLT